MSHYESFCDERHESEPTNDWWVYLGAVMLITDEVTTTVTALQDRKLIMSVQKRALDDLVLLLCAKLKLTGPNEVEIEEDQMNVVVGEFSANIDDTHSVLMALEHLLLKS